MKPETIEKLKMSKMSCEAEAFTCGKIQAMELLDEEPDYSFLCTLLDTARAWGKDEDVDLSCLDFSNYPDALVYHVICGFFQTITELHDEFKAALQEPAP
jgi:hypothetical protein